MDAFREMTTPAIQEGLVFRTHRTSQDVFFFYEQYVVHRTRTSEWRKIHTRRALFPNNADRHGDFRVFPLFTIVCADVESAPAVTIGLRTSFAEPVRTLVGSVLYRLSAPSLL